MTHWKKLMNPNYLGAYAFEPGQEIIGTIKTVGTELVTGEGGKQEECTVIHFTDPEIKPLIANVTNCKTIARLYGDYVEGWTGKPIILFVQKVNAFGEMTDAVRIRSSKPPLCEECGAAILPMNGKTYQEMANYTKDKYGKKLCAKCATAYATTTPAFT